MRESIGQKGLFGIEWGKGNEVNVQTKRIQVRKKALPDNPKQQSSGKILAGGQRKKGERGDQYNDRAHKAYKDGLVEDKKRSGNWLPKEAYEKLTGKPGRKD